MIALKVAVNGKVLCIAGAEDLGVLNAIVGAGGNLGKLTKQIRDESPDVSLRVGGLTSRENDSDDHLNWVESLDLTAGDLVTIEILESNSVDAPAGSRPYDEKRHSKRKKEDWEYAKEIYFTFKDEFESGAE